MITLDDRGRSRRTLWHPFVVPSALALLLYAVAPAGAQQPNRLTLQKALELASRQNLDLAAARQRRSVAQAGVRIARQLPNPTATVAVLRDTPHESLFFEQPLEIGGKRHRRIELAQQNVGLTELEIDAVARQTRRKTREAYYAAALAQGGSAQRGQAAQLARRVREIAQARYDAGDVPQLEVLQGDLEVSRAEAELSVAQQREKIASSQLNALLNEPPETRWELDGALEELPPRLALPELLQKAESFNADLQHLVQEQKVEQSRQALLRAERIPTLNVQFGADFNSPPSFRVGGRSQLSLMLPIFTRNQGEIAQSAASQRLLEGEIAATRRAVAGRVEAAYFDWNARQTQVELYRASLLPATRRLEGLAEESYRAGRANLLTVLDAQRNVQQTERDYLDSLLALQAAFAGLEEAIGAPLD
jgi:cobalt-zinc-cadmium efflux system outer membrane protein